MKHTIWHSLRLSDSLKPAIGEQAGIVPPLDMIPISIRDCFKTDEN